MRTLLVEAGIITLYIFAHLHTDIIIYSVMDTTPFTNDYVSHITFCVLCTPRGWLQTLAKTCWTSFNIHIN